MPSSPRARRRTGPGAGPPRETGLGRSDRTDRIDFASGGASDGWRTAKLASFAGIGLGCKV